MKDDKNENGEGGIGRPEREGGGSGSRRKQRGRNENGASSRMRRPRIMEGRERGKEGGSRVVLPGRQSTAVPTLCQSELEQAVCITRNVL